MKLITKYSELPNLSDTEYLVCDTETSGLNPYLGDRICGFVIGSLKTQDGWYIPLRHKEFSLPNAIPWLQSLASDPTKKFIFHNAKFDLKMFRKEGVEFKAKIMDTMVLAYVHDSSFGSVNTDQPDFDFEGTNESRLKSLDELTELYLPGFKHVNYHKLESWFNQHQPERETDYGRIGRNYSTVPIQLMADYALEDLEATRLLFNKICNMIIMATAPENHGCQSWSTKELLHNEFELTKVLFEMEDVGVTIDVNKTVELRDKGLEECENLVQHMCDLSGFSFQPTQWKAFADAFEAAGGTLKYWNLPEPPKSGKKNKPKKTQHKFAEDFVAQIGVNCKGKQKAEQFTEDKSLSTGRPNFNAVAVYRYLEEYKNTNAKAFDFIKSYRDYGMRAKAISTYIDTFLQRRDFNDALHCNFDQTGTVTGRLSAKNPALQTICKSSGTLDQKALEDKILGGKETDAINRKIRGLMVARPGKVLVSIDWKAAEYRVAVHVSHDERMIQKWVDDPALDYHTQTQEDLKIGRSEVKVVNFGSLFGMSARGLSSALTAIGKVTSKEGAQDFLNKLFTARPALKTVMDRTKNQAKYTGVIQNPFGRVVKVPRDFAYKALNYLVQGTTGDKMREALVRIAAAIKLEGRPIVILLTVHDEIVIEVPENEVFEQATWFSEQMNFDTFLSVPMLTDVEVGYTWQDSVPLLDWMEGKRE